MRQIALGQAIKPLLTLRAALDVGDDPSFLGRVELLIQQATEFSGVRTRGHGHPSRSAAVDAR
jgi:hypothetical protein